MPQGHRVIDRVGEMADWNQDSFDDGEYARWNAATQRYVGAAGGGGGGGTLVGGGAAGQVAFWAAADELAGETALWWDAAADRLGVGTAAPAAVVHVVAAADTPGLAVAAAAGQTAALQEWRDADGDAVASVTAAGVAAFAAVTAAAVTGLAAPAAADAAVNRAYADALLVRQWMGV